MASPSHYAILSCTILYMCFTTIHCAILYFALFCEVELASPSLSRGCTWHPHLINLYYTTLIYYAMLYYNLFYEGGGGIPSPSKGWAWHPNLTIIYYIKQEYSTIFSVHYNMFFHPTLYYTMPPSMEMEVASPSISRRSPSHYTDYNIQKYSFL